MRLLIAFWEWLIEDCFPILWGFLATVAITAFLSGMAFWSIRWVLTILGVI